MTEILKSIFTNWNPSFVFRDVAWSELVVLGLGWKLDSHEVSLGSDDGRDAAKRWEGKKGGERKKEESRPGMRR